MREGIVVESLQRQKEERAAANAGDAPRVQKEV